MTEERWLLPKSWIWVQAKEIAEIVGGGTPSTNQPDNFDENGIPWLTPADLSKNKSTYVGSGVRSLSEKGLANSGAKLLPKGTVLFTSRAPIGYCTIAANPISTNQGFKSFVLQGDISPEFIRYYLLASKDYAESLASGTTFKELSGKRAEELAVPIAPLNEQRRIVTKIEALMDRSKRAKAALDAIPPLLEQFRQSILSAAFRGDLTADWRENQIELVSGVELLKQITEERFQNWKNFQLRKKGKLLNDVVSSASFKIPNRLENISNFECPDSWTWARAEEICDFITKGTTPSAEKMTEGSGEIPYIKVYNLTNYGSLDFTINPTFISQIVHKGELARSRVFPGDILMNIVGPPLGKVSIVPDYYDEWNINQAIAVYRAMPGINNKFLCYCLLAKPILSVAVRAAKATAGQFNLTLEICRDLPLPVPPTLEQHEIVLRIEQLFALADKLEKMVRVSSYRNKSLCDSILAQAFRGELVPQDPSDEPASALLERIREERRQAEGAGGKKRGRGSSSKQLSLDGE